MLTAKKNASRADVIFIFVFPLSLWNVGGPCSPSQVIHYSRAESALDRPIDAMPFSWWPTPPAWKRAVLNFGFVQVDPGVVNVDLGVAALQGFDDVDHFGVAHVGAVFFEGDPPHLLRVRYTFGSIFRGSDMRYTLMASNPPWWSAWRWWQHPRAAAFADSEFLKLGFYVVQYRFGF